MRPAVTFVLAAALAGPPAVADVLEGLAFESEALGRVVRYTLYLPPEARPEHRHPVLYLLHGLGGDEVSWTRVGAIEAILDEAIEAGEVPPLIVAMPDGGRSWWVDSAAVGGPGDHARMVAGDFVDHVDRAHPTLPERRSRAIAGHSMGALGALHVGLSHPHRFGAIAAMNLSPGSPLFEHVMSGGTIPDERARSMFDDAFGVPFRPDRFAAAMPETLIALPLSSSAPRLYLHASDDDPWDTHLRTVEFYRPARGRGHAVELRITDGGHDWSVWRRELPWIARFAAGG